MTDPRGEPRLAGVPLREILPTRIHRDEGAKLLVVLTANARPWNARLRRELHAIISPTAIFNATKELQGELKK